MFLNLFKTHIQRIERIKALINDHVEYAKNSDTRGYKFIIDRFPSENRPSKDA